MQLVQPSQDFNVSYAAFDQSDNLEVGFRVYNITTGTPVFVETLAGTSVGFGVYTANYQGNAGQIFLIVGAVYTDGTYTMLVSLYGPDSECYQIIGTSVIVMAFNYTAYDADDALFIRAAVYDTSTGTPVFLQNINLVLAAIGAYIGVFTGTLGKTYVAAIAVYTDGTYSTVNTARAPAAASLSTVESGNVVFELADAILEGQSIDAILEGNCA